MNVLDNRLDGILTSVFAQYESGRGMSSAAQGRERELFVNEVLSRVFPPHFRFSDGDIVDKTGKKSGQIDIALEKPHGYSFPSSQGGPRLFLAENVAAVIEVKSNLQSKWKEVLDSSAKVSKLHRSYSNELLWSALLQLESGNVKIDEKTDVKKIKEGLLAAAQKKENQGVPRIPYYAVGYEGWKKDSTLISKLIEGRVDGVLLLEERKFVTSIGRAKGQELVSGNKSLLAFLHCLELAFSDQPNRPPAYSQYKLD